MNGYIDADAHVIESPDTWSYFPKSMEDLRPVEMSFDDGDEPPYLIPRRNRGVFIDGQIFRHVVNSDDATGTTTAVREMRDIRGRLSEMDELNIAVQVLYPTALLTELTRRPEVEIALCQAYNRWIADRCEESNGRLRWTAVLPLHSIPDALQEMRHAKDAGAIGIFKRGYECDERRASDPYFHPIYALAQELELPICFHAAHPYMGRHNALTKTQRSISVNFFTIDAFLAILMEGTCKHFPSLRFGIIEAAAGWLPYALWLAGFDSLYTNSQTEASSLRQNQRNLLEENRIFVTCEVSEDIPYLLNLVGNRNLCLGTDFAHSDRASILRAHEEFGLRPDLDAEAIENMTAVAGRRFYGL